MFIFVVLMLFSVSIVTSDSDTDNHTGGHSVVRVRTPLSRVALSATAAAGNLDSDNDLCDAVVQSTNLATSRHVHYIRPFLVEVIRETKSSPTAEGPRRVQSLKRLKSGEFTASPDHGADRDIQDMVSAAVQRAMDKQQQEIDERWSKTQVAISSSISSVIVGLVVGLSQYFSTKP